MRLAEAPDLLTVEEARAILRCGRNQLYAAVRANEIPSIRIRGAIRIPKAALVEMCGGDGNGTTPEDEAGAARNHYGDEDIENEDSS